MGMLLAFVLIPALALASYLLGVETGRIMAARGYHRTAARHAIDLDGPVPYLLTVAGQYAAEGTLITPPLHAADLPLGHVADCPYCSVAFGGVGGSGGITAKMIPAPDDGAP
jgi:hypothetical protein